MSSDARSAPVPRLLAVVAAWSWRLLLALTAIAVLGFLLLQVLVVVVPVILALFLAAVLEPAVGWLRRRGWPSMLAAWVVFMVSLLLLGSTGYWVGKTVAGQFGDVGEQVSEGVEQVKDWLTGEPFNLSASDVDRLEEQVRSSFQSGQGGLTRTVAGGARTVTQVLAGLVLMLFTLFFVLKDGKRIGDWLLERAPPAYRDDATEVANRSRLVMRQYLAATAITGAANAVLIGVALALIGVPLVLPLATLTFLGGFFPIVGATVAGAVASLVALVSGGFTDALLVLAVTIFVQQFEGNVLQPIVLERAIKLHPLVTTWAVAAGLVVGGLLGAFLSVPAVAIAVKVGSYYRGRRVGTLVMPESAA